MGACILEKKLQPEGHWTLRVRRISQDVMHSLQQRKWRLLHLSATLLSAHTHRDTHKTKRSKQTRASRLLDRASTTSWSKNANCWMAAPSCNQHALCCFGIMETWALCSHALPRETSTPAIPKRNLAPGTIGSRSVWYDRNKVTCAKPKHVHLKMSRKEQRG